MTETADPGSSRREDQTPRGSKQKRRMPEHEPKPPSSGQGSAGRQTRSSKRSTGPEAADAATLPCDEAASSSPVSPETESLYHEALLKVLASPDGYEAIGLPGPPHTVRHNTVAEWVAGMKILHVCP